MRHNAITVTTGVTIAIAVGVVAGLASGCRMGPANGTAAGAAAPALAPSAGQAPQPLTAGPSASPTGAGTSATDGILLTIFLKHDQSKTLGEIGKQLDKTEFWRHFPPQGIEVVSWYVMMGIGQVVTLRVPPQRLREVNLAIERYAWNAFRTEFYPTYDFRSIWQQRRQQAQK